MQCAGRVRRLGWRQASRASPVARSPACQLGASWARELSEIRSHLSEASRRTNKEARWLARPPEALETARRRVSGERASKREPGERKSGRSQGRFRVSSLHRRAGDQVVLTSKQASAARTWPPACQLRPNSRRLAASDQNKPGKTGLARQARERPANRRPPLRVRESAGRGARAARCPSRATTTE